MQQMIRKETLRDIACIVGLVAGAITIGTFVFKSWLIEASRRVMRRVKESDVLDINGHPITRRAFERLRRVARAGAVTIALIAVIAFAAWAWPEWQASDEIIVLVTEIHSRGPDPYPVTDKIIYKLRRELDKIRTKENRKAALVHHLEQSVSEGEGRDKARALGTGGFGRRDDATMVIWGWYSYSYSDSDVDPDHEAALHLELLRQPSGIPGMKTGQPGPFSIANLETLNLERELLEKMIWLTASVEGMVYYFLQDYDPACERFTRAVSDLESSEEAVGLEQLRLYRANACYHQDPDQAKTDLTEVLRMNPDFAEAYNSLGAVRWKLGERKDDEAIADFKKAMEIMAKATEIDPDLAKVYHNLGVVHYVREDYEQAIAHFDKATEIDPNLAEAYARRGLAYRKQGEYEKAIADFTEAIGINPNYAKAYHDRGVTYYNRKEYDLAIADFTEAIGIDPDYANAYYRGGLTYLIWEEYEQAIANFELYLDLPPAWPNAETRRTRVQQYIDELRGREQT